MDFSIIIKNSRDAMLASRVEQFGNNPKIIQKRDTNIASLRANNSAGRKQIEMQALRLYKNL